MTWKTQALRASLFALALLLMDACGPVHTGAPATQTETVHVVNTSPDAMVIGLSTGIRRSIYPGESACLRVASSTELAVTVYTLGREPVASITVDPLHSWTLKLQHDLRNVHFDLIGIVPGDRCK
jgi:hypothetical protein